MQNEHKKNKEDLKAYRILNLTMLQFMAVLAILGIVLAVCVHYFF